MVTLATPADQEQWDAYATGSARAHSYHLWAWRGIIETSFGHSAHYLWERDLNGRVTGILPLVRLRSFLFGDFLVSVPYVNYGGPCADTPATARALCDAAVRLSIELGVSHTELRMEEATEMGLQIRSAKISMRLPLPGSSDDLWRGFSSKLRSQIKRGQQGETTVRIGREDQLDSFYHVFSINMRDLGTPVYDRRFFRNVLQSLPASTWIVCVYHEQEPVAAGFLVNFRGTLEIPWASSQRRFNRLSPNMVLYWSVLQFACERGFTMFDFGRSSPETGPHRFKAQWGATAVPLNWQYWVPPGHHLPDMTPHNSRYKLAVRVWQQLPVAITRLLGPPIVRNIP